MFLLITISLEVSWLERLIVVGFWLKSLLKGVCFILFRLLHPFVQSCTVLHLLFTHLLIDGGEGYEDCFFFKLNTIFMSLILCQSSRFSKFNPFPFLPSPKPSFHLKLLTTRRILYCVNSSVGFIKFNNCHFWRLGSLP